MERVVVEMGLEEAVRAAAAVVTEPAARVMVTVVMGRAVVVTEPVAVVMAEVAMAEAVAVAMAVVRCRGTR